MRASIPSKNIEDGPNVRRFATLFVAAVGRAFALVPLK
jgi:hypothetical protein